MTKKEFLEKYKATQSKVRCCAEYIKCMEFTIAIDSITIYPSYKAIVGRIHYYGNSKKLLGEYKFGATGYDKIDEYIQDMRKEFNYDEQSA